MKAKKEHRTANRRLAQWRVTWLIEHSTSHLFLWCIDSFVLRNPPSQSGKTLAVSVKRQPTHIQAHLILPNTQSRPFAKPKELEFFPTHVQQNSK